MNAHAFNAHMVSGFDPMQADLVLQAPQTPLHLAPVGAKAVDLDCDGGPLSSDAGVVLLQDSDDHLGLTHDLAAVLSDPRDARRVKVPLHDLRKQRVLQSAAGSEDANDANTLRDAPIGKLMLDRLPATGAPLASQPTMARCENRVSRPALSRMAVVVLTQFIASYDRPPKVIVLEVDDTEDRVHGQQEQARYDGYDGGYGFMPLHLSAGLSGRLLTTSLKAKRCTGTQMLAVWQRVVKRRRHAWPATLLILRGDSHFAYPEVRQWLEAAPDLSYVTGLPSHAVLQELAREVVEQAKRADAYSGHNVTRFHATRSHAETWSRARRVVSKVEGCAPGVNTRFVVTEREPARTKVLSQQMYCARGQAENESKDHTLALKSDRTSCHRCAATPCRLLWHSAAYVWLETLRREVFRTTQWAAATLETLQLR